MSISHNRRARKGAAKKIHAAHTPPETPDSPCFIGARRISARSPTHECMPPASFDDKKNSDFWGEFRGGWGARGMGESGRPAPRAARVLRAPGRGGEDVWPGRGWGVGRGSAQDPAATSAALPCGRGCRGRAISRRNSSAGAIRGASAREVPAPPSARDVQAGPAQGPAATSAALPCRRGCRGCGISRRNSSEVKSRIPKPAAGGPQLCGPQDLIAEAMTPFRLRFWP